MAWADRVTGKPRRSAPDHCGPDCQTCERLRGAAVMSAFESGLPSLTAAGLAERAGLAEHDLARHRSGRLSTCVAEAYGEATLALQRDFAARFGSGDTWSSGLELATDGLLRTMVARPDVASFCYVEVLRGDRALLDLRDVTRRRSVRLFTRQYTARRGNERVPRLELEFVCGAIIHAIARAAERRQTVDVDGTVEAVMHLAGTCEPLPRVRGVRRS
jgi:hypothetical protein